MSTSTTQIHQDQEDRWKSRVLNAAEWALKDHGYVSPIDILTGMQLLAPSNVEAWKKGRLAILQEMIQGSPKKISRAFALFYDWAAAQGLKPVETAYVRSTRDGPVNLQFTFGGEPAVEKAMRTHYVSPALPESKQRRVTEKLSEPEPPAVFMIVRDSACSECGVELERGSLLYMEADRPLCLACARMDDLDYLSRGDAALTRRATKYSGRMAVVLQFSRSRGRYERQGILVETAALEKAEEECDCDAADRAQARAAAEARRQKDDHELIAQMTGLIKHMFPRCSPKEAAAIAAHTAKRGSGRVGRSAAGRNLEEKALTAAVAAAVRHKHTDYDELLASGVDREVARERVAERVHSILDGWRAL